MGINNDNNFTLNAGDRLIDLSHPVVMGILNSTPDSFFSQSRMQAEHDIASRANDIMEQGAEIIDIGAFSTRPGASNVSTDEEMKRMRRALTIVRKQQPNAILSVDTFRPEVARMAVEEYGAGIINDISEGTGSMAIPTASTSYQDMPSEMFITVAQLGVAYILTSVQPTMRQTLMQLSGKIQQLHGLGQKDIIIDPGLGFGKTVEQNYDILRELPLLSALNKPLLIGLSRKSMIWKPLATTPDGALNGTTALHMASLLGGAHILRAHDVKECVETVKLYNLLQGNVQHASNP